MIYNNSFIALLAKKYPALARLVELVLYTFISALIGAIIAYFLKGDLINWALIAATTLTPVHAAIGKKIRNLKDPVITNS